MNLDELRRYLGTDGPDNVGGPSQFAGDVPVSVDGPDRQTIPGMDDETVYRMFGLTPPPSPVRFSQPRPMPDTSRDVPGVPGLPLATVDPITQGSQLPPVRMEPPLQPQPPTPPEVEMPPLQVPTPEERAGTVPPPPTDPFQVPNYVRGQLPDIGQQQVESALRKGEVLRQQAEAEAARKADQASAEREATRIAQERIERRQQMVDLAMADQHDRSRRLADAAGSSEALFPTRRSLSSAVGKAMLAISAGMGSQTAAALLNSTIEQERTDDANSIKARDSYIRGLSESAQAAGQEVSSYATAAQSGAQTELALQSARKEAAAQELEAIAARYAPGKLREDTLQAALALRQQNMKDVSAAAESQVRSYEEDLKLRAAEASMFGPKSMTIGAVKMPDRGSYPPGDTGDAEYERDYRVADVKNRLAGQSFTTPGQPFRRPWDTTDRVAGQAPSSGGGGQASPPSGGPSTVSAGQPGVLRRPGSEQSEYSPTVPPKDAKVVRIDAPVEKDQLEYGRRWVQVPGGERIQQVVDVQADDARRSWEQSAGIPYSTERIAMPDGTIRSRTRYLMPPRGDMPPDWEKSEKAKKREVLSSTIAMRDSIYQYAQAASLTDKTWRSWAAQHSNFLNELGISDKDYDSAEALRSIMVFQLSKLLEQGVVRESEQKTWDGMIAGLKANESDHSIPRVKASVNSLLKFLDNRVVGEFQGYDMEPFLRDSKNVRSLINGLGTPVTIRPGEPLTDEGDVKKLVEDAQKNATTTDPRAVEQMHDRVMRSNIGIRWTIDDHPTKGLPGNAAPGEYKGNTQAIIDLQKSINTSQTAYLKAFEGGDWAEADKQRAIIEQARRAQAEQAEQTIRQIASGLTILHDKRHDFLRSLGLDVGAIHNDLMNGKHLGYWPLKPAIDRILNDGGASLGKY